MTPDPLHIDSPEQGILFAFGAARSGTTQLGRMLEKLFDFGMGPEGHFVTEIGQKLGRYGDLQQSENMERLLQDVHDSGMLHIMRARWREEIRTDITLPMLQSALHSPDYAGVVYSVFHNLAVAQGRSRVGNKNPDFWRHLDLLESHFGTRARYLNIVRDGRDVALSNLKQRWGRANVLACARVWRRSVATARAFGERIGPERFLTLRYEDLLTDPGGTVDQMAAFFQVPSPRAKLHTLEQDEKSRSRPDNFGKWRQSMSPREQRIYEAEAGDELAFFGYDTVVERPRLGVVENLYLSAQELGQQVLRNVIRR